jgi:uncharacterized protein
VRRWLGGEPAATSRLSEIEIASALGRQAPEGTFSVTERDRALASLENDFAALIVVELTPDVAAVARGLPLRHPLRAADAIQVASCLYLQREIGRPLAFIAFDVRLTEAARAEGLTILPASG